MSIIAMGSGGGLNNTKLRLADAAVDDVLKGRKFYSGDKTLKTGTLELTGTAYASDVLYGETFYNTNAKTKITGTLELTGNAYADDVLMGRTFYNTNAKTKVTGTLALTGTAYASDVLYGETFYNTDAKTKITGTLTLTGTAYASDVLYGETFYNTDAKTKITGTLALTGTAYASDVLYGETFYNTDAKTKITGTMPNRGAVDTTINPGSSYTIPAGYHNGNGKVTAVSLKTMTITMAPSSMYWSYTFTGGTLVGICDIAGTAYNKDIEYLHISGNTINMKWSGNGSMNRQITLIYY